MKQICCTNILLFFPQWSKFDAAEADDDDASSGCPDIAFAVSDNEDDEDEEKNDKDSMTRSKRDIWSRVQPTQRTNKAFRKYLNTYTHDDERKGFIIF